MAGAVLTVVFAGLVIGPLAVIMIMQPSASLARLRPLGLAVLGLMLGAFLVVFTKGFSLLAAVLLWVAWLVSMALMGQVLRLMLGRPDSRAAMAGAAIGALAPLAVWIVSIRMAN